MANNRITYSTAQLSIKDNKADATADILGWKRTAQLAAGINSSATTIVFKNADGTGAAISGVWGNDKMFRVKTGSNAMEYVRYTTWASSSGLASAGVTRGAGGSTASAHLASDVCQLAGWEVPLGVQSVSIGTAFNTEDVFTLGQLDPYENVEGIPEVEVSIERVFDGSKPLWLMCTDQDHTNLKGRTASYKCDVAVSVYPDTQDSATGTPDSTVVVSGCYISSWGASFVTDGNFTESVTLVGNDKTWGGQEGVPSGFFLTADSYDAGVNASGVQRSEDFVRSTSTIPAEITAADKIQSIEVSVDIGREEIMQLGQKTPYFRAVDYPVAVTTTFEVITDKGDGVNALGTGANNLVNRSIIIKTKEGLTIDLGAKNKLSNVSFEGFDAGGGNGTCTFEYTNSNHLTITHTKFSPAFSTNSDLVTGDNA